MLVAIVESAIEYQERLRELKKYSSAELLEAIFPRNAMNRISAKYPITIMKSIIVLFSWTFF